MRNALLIVVAAALGCSGPLDKKRLHGEIRQLRSIAAETRLVLAIGRHPSYAANHRPALARRVVESRKQLARGVSEPALERACSEARRLAAGLGVLAIVAAAPDQLDDLIRRFERLERETQP